MASMLFTRNGHNMFDVSSLIQKALRRGDTEFSCYAVHEMMWKYRPYLWVRMLITSGEDCYDLITHRVLHLRKLDDQCKDPLNTTYLSEAVNLIARTRKNRDADFFACNFIYSRYKKDYPIGDGVLVTRHGHDLKAAMSELKKAILKCEEENIGYLASEIWNWYRPVFWVVAREVAKELESESIVREIEALREVDLCYNGKNTKEGSWIYMCKAIVTFLHCIEAGSTSIFQYPDMRGIPDVMKFSSRRELPDYTYDCHTSKGRAMGKTVFDFRISEQSGLNPHVQGLYDDLAWDNSTKWNEEGRFADYNTPKIPKGILESVYKGIFPSSIFDI